MKRDLYSGFSEEEAKFIAKVDIDYVSLANIVNMFAGVYIPTEEDYLNALEFIKYLMDKYKDRLKRYLGPGVEAIDKKPEEFIMWLEEIWYKGEYFNEKMDYSIWFDLDEEEES